MTTLLDKQIEQNTEVKSVIQETLRDLYTYPDSVHSWKLNIITGEVFVRFNCRSYLELCGYIPKSITTNWRGLYRVFKWKVVSDSNNEFLTRENELSLEIDIIKINLD